jgi:trigger factor
VLYRGASQVPVKVSTEKIPESQLLMTIEVEQERLDKAREKAVRKLAPKARVPGFRPGKAPVDMVRRYFGEERILDEALDDLVPVIYREAVEADESIEPVARPRLVVETTEPLVVKATIPVRPSIELGEYTGVRVEFEPVTVEEERVDEVLLTLRRRNATLEPVERPLEWRDVVRLEVEATVDVEGAAPSLVDPSGKPLLASTQRETLVTKQEAEVQLTEERDVLFPGFEEQLISKRKGDECEFDLAIPDDFTVEKFRGKQAHFRVKLIETKAEVLPDVDDEEFLRQMGDFADVDALRVRIRDDLQRAAEEQRNDGYYDEILTKLVDQSTIEYPPVMADVEVDRMLHDEAGHVDRGGGLERYLAAIGRTEEQVREDFRPVADHRLRRSLVLTEVAEREGLDVTPDEIDAEIDRLTGGGPNAGQLRPIFNSEDGRSTIRRNLLTRKTLGRLLEIATEGRAKPPEPAPTPVAETPAGTPIEQATEDIDETPSEGGEADPEPAKAE